MTIYNLGSINIDRVYALPHLPQPGETLASLSHSVGLGGKGANQSAAAARFGAEVRHLGAVGSDGGAIDGAPFPANTVSTLNSVAFEEATSSAASSAAA